MKPELSKKIEVDKIAKTLGVDSYNQTVSGHYIDQVEPIEVTNVKLFDLLEDDEYRLRLCYITNTPTEVKLIIDYKEFHTAIRFLDITKVLYNPKLNIIIFESKNKTSHSQLRVAKNSTFDLSVNHPNSNYKNSWLKIMAENLGLIEYSPEE